MQNVEDQNWGDEDVEVLTDRIASKYDFDEKSEESQGNVTKFARD